MEDVRDRFFTLRIEDALRLLTRQPKLPIAYLARRYNHEQADLQAWLDEFNGGSKQLTGERIDAVKRELGALNEGTDNRPAAAPKISAPVAATEAPAAKPAAPAAAPAPARPAAPAKAEAISRPWETAARQFRAKVFLGWRPIIEKLAAGGSAKELCKAASVTPEGLANYLLGWLDARGGHSPETLRAFIAWGDERCAALPPPAAAPQRAPAPSPAKFEIVSEEWKRWRADAIAALVAMGTKARRAELQVDAAIAELRGEDCDTGELVKRAMRQNPIDTTTPATPKPKPAAPATAPAAKVPAAALPIGGTLFRIELIVRLVPMEAVAEVPS